MRRVWLGISLLTLLAAQTGAQRVELRVGEGPHYAGVPIELEVIAENFQESPKPTYHVEPPALGRLEFLGVNPSVRSQITIVNGQLSQFKEVKFVYRFRYTTLRAGAVEIGPFRIEQAGTALSTRKLKLVVATIPRSDRLHVLLRLPEQPVYPGARVPITLEWWLDLELRKNLHSYTLRVPFFDATEAFQFSDPEPGPGQMEFTIQTRTGKLRLHGQARERTLKGRRYFVVSATRTLIALKVGEFKLAPASLIVDEATRWERDLFRGRRVTQVRKHRALDRAQQLRVEPLPRAGQPPSFAGAIGSGFSLEVTADRTVVKVGDPITLTLKLRGQGNLESAGLPPLWVEGGLSRTAFRLPADPAVGTLEEGEKTFQRAVRVMDPAVTEIPALAYSYFDVESGSYQTVRSRPIALSVGGAEMVRAEDVVSTEPAEGERARAPAGDSSPPGERPARRRAALRRTGANLALEQDLGILLRDDTHERGPWLWSGLYGAPLLLILLAVLARRRASLDPEWLRRRRVLHEGHRRILAALRRADREAVAEVSSTLRKMLAEVPQARSAALDDLLAECDTITFAPSEVVGELRPELAERARALSEGLRGHLA